MVVTTGKSGDVFTDSLARGAGFAESRRNSATVTRRNWSPAGQPGDTTIFTTSTVFRKAHDYDTLGRLSRTTMGTGVPSR